MANGHDELADIEAYRFCDEGLQFGADTNANTSWDETVFQFDLQKNDDDSIGTGVKLLRETASNLTIAQSAIDSEKLIVSPVFGQDLTSFAPK